VDARPKCTIEMCLNDGHLEDTVQQVRTRRSGTTSFVEIRLGSDAERRIGDVDQVNAAIACDLEAPIRGVSVTVIATTCLFEHTR
jgi:divalent metal cation (Fe/Co/Zn/Cd) transporter